VANVSEKVWRPWWKKIEFIFPSFNNWANQQQPPRKMW
jgi:hypothetical protein